MLRSEHFLYVHSMQQGHTREIMGYRLIDNLVFFTMIDFVRLCERMYLWIIGAKQHRASSTAILAVRKLTH